MAYSFQTYAVGQVLTAAQMNQEEVNIRDHIHGKDGVGGTTRTLSPETTATYDLGTSALVYRTLYASNWQGPPFATIQWMQMFTDFDVASSGGTQLIPVLGARWSSRIFDSGATLSALTVKPQSEGVLDMVHDATQTGARLTNVFPELRAAVYDWPSMDFSALVLRPSGADDSRIKFAFGIGELDFMSSKMVTNSGDLAAWTFVGSSALAPQTRLGATSTTGNSVAFLTNTPYRLAVHLSSGTAQFIMNGSLWQTLTATMPSTRYLTGTVEMMSSGNYGLNPSLTVYDMTFTVNSTI